MVLVLLKTRIMLVGEEKRYRIVCQRVVCQQVLFPRKLICLVRRLMQSGIVDRGVEPFDRVVESFERIA